MPHGAGMREEDLAADTEMGAAWAKALSEEKVFFALGDPATFPLQGGWRALAPVLRF